MTDALPRGSRGATWLGLPLILMLFPWAPVALAAPAPSLVGREAPDFTLKSTAGQNLRLSEYRGQVVLLNFWARWEGDSRRELPALDRINQTYARAGLIVLGVSIEPDRRRAGEYAASLHVSYPVLIAGNGTLGRDYAIEKMPMTILIDRAGIVRYVHVGFDTADENVYMDQIRALLRD